MTENSNVPLNRKLILYGLFLLIVSLAVFYVFTLKKESLHILFSIPYKDVVLLFVLWGLYILFDSLKLSLISNIGKHNMGISLSFKTIVIGIFLAAITPFQVSGLPVQIYYLTRFGVGAGEATSYLLLRGAVTFAGILTLALPFSYILRNTFTGVMKGIYMYALFVISFITVLYVLILFLPGTLKKIVKGKMFEEFMSLRKVLMDALSNGRGRIYLFYSFIATICSLFVLGLIPYFVQHAIGRHFFGFWQSIGYEMIAISSLLFTPTPGGSGLAEAAGSFIFLSGAKREYIFPFVVLWRFFTFYITAVFGAIVFLIETRKMLK